MAEPADAKAEGDVFVAVEVERVESTAALEDLALRQQACPRFILQGAYANPNSEVDGQSDERAPELEVDICRALRLVEVEQAVTRRQVEGGVLGLPGAALLEGRTISQQKSDPVWKGAASPRKDQSALSKRFKVMRPPWMAVSKPLSLGAIVAARASMATARDVAATTARRLARAESRTTRIEAPTEAASDVAVVGDPRS